MNALNVHFKNGDTECVLVEMNPEDLRDFLFGERITEVWLKTSTGYYMFNPTDVLSIQTSEVD